MTAIVKSISRSELSEEERKFYDDERKASDAKDNEILAKIAQEKADAKTGNDKLLGLGLTQAEATALTGYTPPVEVEDEE